MKTRPALLIALLAAALIPGCAADDAKPTAHEPGLADPPPNYHRPESVPVDADLQRAARRQVDRDLRSPDQVVRAHALEAVAIVPPADPGPLVLPLLDDPSPLVRKAAAMTAGRLKLAAAHDRLLQMAVHVAPASAPANPHNPGHNLLQEAGQESGQTAGYTTPLDPNDPTYQQQARLAAVFALHQLGDTRYSHTLELSAQDPRPQIRGDTALILELIGNTSAEPILLHMLKTDPSQNVRLQAAEALWQMHDEAGLDFLIPATLSGYASDNILALLGLAGPRDRRVLGHVQGFLSYEDHPEVALAAARAAGQLDCDWGVGVAERWAKAGDPRQRGMAALALGDIGRHDSQPVLATLLHDPQPDVRVAAAIALLQVGRR